MIVKTIVRPGTGYVGQFAVMRKLDGRWRFVEYHRSERHRPRGPGRSRRGQLGQFLPRAGKAIDYATRMSR